MNTVSKLLFLFVVILGVFSCSTIVPYNQGLDLCVSKVSNGQDDPIDRQSEPGWG